VGSLVGGYWLWQKICKEQNWLANGGTYEPTTFYQRNKYLDDPAIPLCHSVTVNS
jgi:hypothetical protein